MLKSPFLPVALWALLLLAAGCAGPRELPPDWSDEAAEGVEPEQVTEGPRIAAPPQQPIPAPPTIARTNLTFAETWIPLKRWSRELELGTVQPAASGAVNAVELSNSNRTLALRAGSTVALCDGLEVRLGFEPILINEQLYLHTLDLQKNVEPLMRGGSLPQKIDRVVVIDPGHGGSQGGTRSVLDGSNEKDYSLDWAFRLRALLETNGWRVLLTRTNDVDLSLSNRVAVAEEHQADLFISLHFNSAAPNPEPAGLETFCLTPVGMQSTLTRGFEDDPQRVFPNNAFDAQNIQYAVRLHHALLQQTGLADRGVRRARFQSVVRGNNRPAVLLEAGYLSNPTDARRIASPEFRQKLAEAVAEALKSE